MRNTPLPRRVRTLAAAATACALAVTTLAACGSDGSENAGGGGEQLDVWIYDDGSTKIQEDFLNNFNKTADVKLKMTKIPGDSYQDKLRTAMGTGNEPDIFFNWGGGSISEFVDEGMLVDLTPHLDDHPQLEEFVPVLWERGKIDDKLYGIPMRGVQPVLLFHNKDMLNEAGVEVPETWDQLMTMVDTLTDQGETPFVLAGGTSWTELMWLEYLVDRIGGPELFQTIQDGDSSAWGDPAVLESAKKVKELINKNAFGKNFKSVEYTNESAPTLFSQGKGAMHLMGSWEYPTQKDIAPEFAEKSLGWATFPTIEGGKGDANSIVGNPTNYWSINSDVKGERLDTAIEYLKAHASEEYAQALIDNGDVPTTANAKELLDSHPNPEYAKWQYDLVQNAEAFTLSWDQALPAKQAEGMMTNIEKLFNTDMSAQEFVDAMKAL